MIYIYIYIYIYIIVYVCSYVCILDIHTSLDFMMLKSMLKPPCLMVTMVQLYGVPSHGGIPSEPFFCWDFP